MRGLAEDQSIVIRLPTDTRPCIVFWDRENYLVGIRKQLKNADIYNDTGFKESDLFKLVKKAISCFNLLEGRTLSQRRSSIFFLSI